MREIKSLHRLMNCVGKKRDHSPKNVFKYFKIQGYLTPYHICSRAYLTCWTCDACLVCLGEFGQAAFAECVATAQQ